MIQGRPLTTRKSRPGLRFEGAPDQLWEGFGACFHEAGWRALSALKAMDAQRVLQALFEEGRGPRLSVGVIPVGGTCRSSDPRSLNEVSGDLAMRHFALCRERDWLFPFVREALRRVHKFKVMALPWSPPAWMKAAPGDRLAWQPEILAAYALYLARFVQACRLEGIPVHRLCAQNAPFGAGPGPACRWTPAHLRDFVRNHLGPKFERLRLTTEIWMGALDADDYDGAGAMLRDAMAMQCVKGVALQGEGVALGPRLHRALPDQRWLFLEGGGDVGDKDWDAAHAMFAAMCAAMAAGAMACIHGNLILPADAPGGALVSVDPAAGTYALTPSFHALRHLSAGLDRNAVRLGLAGAWADRAVAFMNEDDSRILILHNPADEPDRVVVADGDRLLNLMLPPRSFHTLAL
jgi:glucosylceramidase